MHLLWLGTVAVQGEESLSIMRDDHGEKKNERDRNEDVGKYRYLLACRNLYANVYNLYLATGDFTGELLMSP